MTYAPFNEHQYLEGYNVQAKNIPMYHASKNVVNHIVEVNDGVHSSSIVLHVEQIQLFDVHQGPQKIGCQLGDAVSIVHVFLLISKPHLVACLCSWFVTPCPLSIQRSHRF